MTFPQNITDALAVAAGIEHDVPDEQMITQFALMARVGGEASLNRWMAQLHRAALEEASKPVGRHTPVGQPSAVEDDPSGLSPVVEVLQPVKKRVRRLRSRPVPRDHLTSRK